MNDEEIAVLAEIIHRGLRDRGAKVPFKKVLAATREGLDAYVNTGLTYGEAVEAVCEMAAEIRRDEEPE